VSSSLPGYVPHQQLRLDLPEAAREAAARRLLEPSVRVRHGGAGRIALLLAGSGERSLYPSAGSWRVASTP
jgi:hypothetical protein